MKKPPFEPETDEQTQQAKLGEALRKLRLRLMANAIISAEVNDFNQLEKDISWIICIEMWLARPKCPTI